MDNRYLETNQLNRTENVIVRLTPQEKTILFREAQKTGISVSAFIRLLLRNWSDGISFTKKNGEV